jgi:hypothetical protein
MKKNIKEISPSVVANIKLNPTLRKEFVNSPANSDESLELEDIIRDILSEKGLSEDDIETYMDILYIERNNNIYDEVPLNEADLGRIKQMLKTNSQVEFKNDPKIYYVKNISPDGVNVFVTLNGLQTYRKSLKNLIKIDTKMINEENDDNTRPRLDKKLRVFIHNFGGKENFEKIQDILRDNNIEFEKKVASFGTKGAANIVGLLISSNLYKPTAASQKYATTTAPVSAPQKYKSTVEILKKDILKDFPQLNYREFKSLTEQALSKDQLKQIIKEELIKIITK